MADGTIAVVRPDPYRVRLVTAEGVSREASPVAYDPIPLSEAHKEAWRERQARPRPTIRGVRGQEGTQVTLSQWPASEPDEWPESLPPYLNEGPYFAPDGTLWVARTVRVGASPPSTSSIGTELWITGFGSPRAADSWASERKACMWSRRTQSPSSTWSASSADGRWCA